MDRLRKPDFLVVGAEKCGTTWLADMLRQHPDVFIPVEKEVHYFNRRFSDFPEIENFNFDKPIEWYFEFFAGAGAGQKIGEACPAYLWDETAAARIHDFEPRLKILMLLRNPAERTYSAYRFWMQRGVVGRVPLKEAVARHSKLLLDRSLYFAQTKRYLDLFPREQVRVWVMDRPDKSMTAILEEVEGFIGVRRLVPANAEARSNVTAEPRFRFANWLTARLRRFVRANRIFVPVLDALRKVNLAQRLEGWRIENKSQAAPTTITMMTGEERAWLGSLLREDIEKLEDLLGMNLEHWKR